MALSVCLCGSTKFIDKFNEANIELTRRGFSVVTISMALPKREDGTEENEALKVLLDLVHLNKILMCDAVFIVSDYMGFSTAREVVWASMHNKPIHMRIPSYTWDQEAHTLRVDYCDTGILPKAKAILGL